MRIYLSSIFAILIAIVIALALGSLFVLLPIWPAWFGFANHTVWELAQPIMYATVSVTVIYILAEAYRRHNWDTVTAQINADREMAQAEQALLEKHQTA